MIRKPILVLLGVCLLGVAIVGASIWGFRDGDQPKPDEPVPDRQRVWGLTEEELEARMRQDVIFMAYIPRRFDEYLKQARENSARRGDPTEVRQSFEAAVVWYRQLREREPEALYEEAKIHWARYDRCVDARGSRCSVHETIARAVARIAGEKGHMEARFDVAQRDIEEDTHDPEIRASDPYLHAIPMQILADDDYVPAQLDLAERHLTGRRVQEDLRLAWYWYRRARSNGADVAAPLADLEAKLTAEDIRAVRWCFRPNSGCRGWNDQVQCLDAGHCPRDE